MQRYLLSVLGASLWINVSEFVRNEVVIKRIWTRGFEEIGLTFPSSLSTARCGDFGPSFSPRCWPT